MQAIERMLAAVAAIPGALLVSATDANAAGERFAVRHAQLRLPLALPSRGFGRRPVLTGTTCCNRRARHEPRSCRVPPRARPAVPKRLIPITSPPLRIRDAGKCIQRRTRIGIRVQPAVSRRSDPSPLPQQHDPAEQVHRQFHPIIAPLIQRRANACQRHMLREQKQLLRLIGLLRAGALCHPGSLPRRVR